MKTLDFLTIDLGTIIGTLANTLILFLILRHFLFGRVNKVLDERQKYVEDSYKDADEAKENAKKLENEYTSKLKSVKEESAEIMKNSIKKAQNRSDELLAAARDEAQEIVERANNDIEREKKRAINEVKDEISDIVIAVASKVIEKEITEKDNDKIIDEFILNVGEMK